jgi:hypothetical protein
MRWVSLSDDAVSVCSNITTCSVQRTFHKMGIIIRSIERLLNSYFFCAYMNFLYFLYRTCWRRVNLRSEVY